MDGAVRVVSHHLDGLLRMRLAGLLHPAADPGIRRVSRVDASCGDAIAGTPSSAIRALPATRFTPLEDPRRQPYRITATLASLRFHRHAFAWPDDQMGSNPCGSPRIQSPAAASFGALLRRRVWEVPPPLLAAGRPVSSIGLRSPSRCLVPPRLPGAFGVRQRIPRRVTGTTEAVWALPASVGGRGWRGVAPPKRCGEPCRPPWGS